MFTADYLSSSLDMVFKVVGLVGAIIGLVRALLSHDQKKPILLTMILVIFFALIALESCRIYQHQAAVNLIAGDIVYKLGAIRMTFDQLRQVVNPPNSTTLSEALNVLIHEGKVRHEILTKFDDTTKEKFYFTVYYSTIVPEWKDFQIPKDFKKGTHLKILVGGTATKILLRFLTIGCIPSSPCEIDNGIREVPASRILEVELESDHPRVMRVSVHGGPNPFSIPLSKDNGPVTLVHIME